jgi:hypothetical protein
MSCRVIFSCLVALSSYSASKGQVSIGIQVLIGALFDTKAQFGILPMLMCNCPFAKLFLGEVHETSDFIFFNYPCIATFLSCKNLFSMESNGVPS